MGHKDKHKPPGQEKKESPEIVQPVEPRLMLNTYSFLAQREHVYDGDTLRDVRLEIFPDITLTLSLIKIL